VPSAKSMQEEGQEEEPQWGAGGCEIGREERRIVSRREDGAPTRRECRKTIRGKECRQCSR